jgi:hypothetical protein
VTGGPSTAAASCLELFGAQSPFIVP